MGITSFVDEITTSIPPIKLFKASILDADNLILKVLPVPVKKIEILEGNGGPGTIKAIHFSEETKLGITKQRVDEIDEKNFVFKCTVIEGYALEGVHDSISYDMKIEPHPDGGSVSRATITYHTNVEDFSIGEELMEQQRAKSKAITKALEAYLGAHPDEYN